MASKSTLGEVRGRPWPEKTPRCAKPRARWGDRQPDRHGDPGRNRPHWQGQPEVIQKLFLREAQAGAKFTQRSVEGASESHGGRPGDAAGEIDAASKKLLGMLPKLPESLARSILQNLGTYTRVVYDRIGDKRWIEAHAPSLTNPVGSLLWDQAAQEIEETLGDQWGPAGSLKRRQQANEVLRNTLMGAPQECSIEQERRGWQTEPRSAEGFESLGDLGPSTRQLLGVRLRIRRGGVRHDRGTHKVAREDPVDPEARVLGGHHEGKPPANGSRV